MQNDIEHQKPVLYSLKLSRTYLEELFKMFRRNQKGNKLVLQFYYSEKPTGGSPTLGAYAMKSNNQLISEDHRGNNMRLLDYDTPSQEPLFGRGQFLGDQQIRISDLKKLIKENKRCEYLLFSPRFKPDNPHVYYDVTAEPNGFGSVSSDPSPPAPAY